MAAGLVLLGLVAVVRLSVSADAARRARAREAFAAAAQYGLLFGFAAVAAAISAHGLIGFARSDMELRGAWPFLLWGALDGAAGLCAVLLMRRAARGESALAPRLAVWGLVAASSVFNWTHAPDRPGAREAFALMPVIAATLFEFSLRETRHAAERTDRRLTGLRWLHPAERVRVQMLLAADATLTAQAATCRVRVDRAARSLHRLRQSLGTQAEPSAASAPAGHRVRRAERRAQAALTRACFADPGIAADVLRQAQILALTVTLAGLDTATSQPARAVLAGLITPELASTLADGQPARSRSAGGSRTRPGTLAADRVLDLRQSGDGQLIDAAIGIVTQASQQGVRLSQAELARQLRARGLSIANDRLRWLAGATGLEPCREPR